MPVGYADGYPRALSGHADVLVRGRRRRVAATVSMDALSVVVDDDVEIGDEVVLVGLAGRRADPPRGARTPRRHDRIRDLLRLPASHRCAERPPDGRVPGLAREPETPVQRPRTLVCLAAASAALATTAVARASSSSTYPRRQVAYLIHHGVLHSRTPHAFHPEKPLAPYLLERMLAAIPGARSVSPSAAGA